MSRHKVRDGERLLLIVRDEERRGPDLELHAANLITQLNADLRVECGKRLIEEEHTRPDGKRTRERDALLLTAGQLVRIAVCLRGRDRRARASPPPAWRVRTAPDLAHAQAECDVLRARSCAGTGNTPERPSRRRGGWRGSRVTSVPPMSTTAAVGVLQAGDEPESRSSCRIPTARGVRRARRERS